MSRQRNLELDLEYLHDADFAKLRTEALRWAKIVRDNPSRPDGYPTTASGNSNPPSGSTHLDVERRELDDLDPDELGHLPASHDTSVERAALTTRQARDRIDMLTATAIQQIHQAADAYRAAIAKFAECHRYQSAADLNPAPECWVMRNRADVHEEKHVTSDINGLLDEPRPVCRWVWDFARAMERLPTRDECRKHARGERVMVAA